MPAFNVLRMKRFESTPAGNMPHHIFPAVLLLSGLDAYAVGPIPFSWIVSSALIVIWLSCVLREPNRLHVWVILFAVLFCWLLGVSLLNTAFANYDALMPLRATTAYPVYVTLRFVNMVIFVAA